LVTEQRRLQTPNYLPKEGTEEHMREEKNHELQELYRRSNIISYMKSKRLEWSSHVWRADGQVMKEVLVTKINKKRPLGRIQGPDGWMSWINTSKI